MSERTQATLEQLLAMNENEKDLQWQRPRSHSLHNMMAADDEYVFKMERDFQSEIQEYVTLRREIRKRRSILLSGQTDEVETAATGD